MCGISGFLGFKNDDLIKQMSQDMIHRGPDGDGYYIDDNVSLLSRRLAIIDRKGGDQPIYNEDKSLVVVYNGEIYNYLELRQELEDKGHKFTTHSDTEVIVHGYEEWGDSSFDRLNGMFGLAIYDLKKKRLVIARDHFGIKPLYFSHIGKNKLIFASEIKPLLHSGLVEKKPNDRIIYRYLRYRIHDDQEETFFQGINKLMPGEMMVLEKGQITRKYFSTLKEDLLNQKPGKEMSTAQISRFKELLTHSVQKRLISEVPVGTALSGGLDSSTVVAIVNQLLKEKVTEAKSVGVKQNSFSAIFPSSANDEEKYVDALLGKLKTVQSHKIQPKPEDFFKEIEDFVRTQEEPTISTGPYAQFKVMEQAHKSVTVLLDGQGADEMMAGYLPYYFVYLRQLQVYGQYRKLLNEVWTSKDVMMKFVAMKLKSKLGLTQTVNPRSLLAEAFDEKYNSEKFIVENYDLRKRLVEDIFHNSLPSLLRYEDKNTMRFSIEGRVPFLDFTLLRYLFSLPTEAIIKDGWNKYILREAVRGMLPDMITNRRNKIGFTTPEHEWFMKMKNRIYGYFMSESFANRKYFNQPMVLKSFQKFIEGKNDDTLVFWRLLNLELWMREFIDEKKVEVKKERTPFTPNEGKQIDIKVENKTYSRFPIKTELFAKGDNYPEKIWKQLGNFLSIFEKETKFKALLDKPWILVCSEKIVAISQGRSYFIWDINPDFWGKTLSKFVKKTPYGIGLGSPWTMQIAINEVGLPRILFASLASVVTKPFGMKGVFYHIAGREVASIDGPTEYSLYPSNVSAKLGPTQPKKAAESIRHYIESELSKEMRQNFQGVVVIDANDLGRDILGNATKHDDKLIAEIFRDNPMGQGSEQTPLTLVFFK